MIKIVNRIFLITALMISLSACSTLLKPKPYGYNAGLVNDAPAGSLAFRYGWKEGCESGLAAYGSLHYKVTYDYSYDTQALGDDEYQNAWELGFRHCRWYVSSWS